VKQAVRLLRQSGFCFYDLSDVTAEQMQKRSQRGTDMALEFVGGARTDDGDEGGTEDRRDGDAGRSQGRTGEEAVEVERGRDEVATAWRLGPIPDMEAWQVWFWSGCDWAWMPISLSFSLSLSHSLTLSLSLSLPPSLSLSLPLPLPLPLPLSHSLSV